MERVLLNSSVVLRLGGGSQRTFSNVKPSATSARILTTVQGMASLMRPTLARVHRTTNEILIRD